MLNRLDGAMALVGLLLAPVAICAAAFWVVAQYQPWLLLLLVPLSIIYILFHWGTYLDLSSIRQIFQSKENS